jgi:hypothetical protein
MASSLTSSKTSEPKPSAVKTTVVTHSDSSASLKDLKKGERAATAKPAAENPH